jgi:hypothetical protein
MCRLEVEVEDRSMRLELELELADGTLAVLVGMGLRRRVDFQGYELVRVDTHTSR